MNNKVINSARNIRERILRMSFESNHTSHLGGSLSIVEMLSVLYFGNFGLMKNDQTSESRNRFILSKGHGALALFSTLIEAGYMEVGFEKAYMKNGSELIAHPIKNNDLGIESSNGSLGQGLSFAIGIAIASMIRKQNRTIFCLMGDGECGEGAVWEAAMSAVDLGINNLIVLIDCNGFQSDGKIRPSLTSQNLAEKWKSFNWEVETVNGHDVDQITDALTRKSSDSPLVLICETIKGKGVSFMENNNIWHHNRITHDLYNQALKELRMV